MFEVSLLAASGFGLYTDGLDLVFQVDSLLLILGGVVIGMLVGAMPGLTANMGVAVLLPLTFTMEPHQAIAAIAGIWLGSLYGGTIPAVLINMPGTPGDIMTSLDGYPLSQKGKGGLAIGVGVLSSFSGGMISVVALATAAPVIAGFARNFGSYEYFAVTFLGLTVIAYLAGSSLAKGLISAAIGLLAGTVGRDLLSGQPRFTFDAAPLLGGLDFIAVIVGIFGLAEVIEQVYLRRYRDLPRAQVTGRIREALREIPALKGVIGRSSAIGVFIGAVPGAGATIASVISYGIQKRFSKKPEEMGEGSLEGLSASDTANNACTGGAMITMLSLGIPGDGITAMMLGALVVQGIRPGPRLFQGDVNLVSAIFISLVVANIGLLLIGLFGARHMAHILRVPPRWLLPLIAVLSVIGTYALSNQIFDVYVMLLFAAVGFVFSRTGIPKPPLVMALILGPILEENLRRGLQLQGGDAGLMLSTMFSRPVSAVLLGFGLLMLLMPLIQGLLGRSRRRPGALEQAADLEDSAGKPQ